MNSAWAKLTFSNLSWQKWRSASHFYRLVGLLSSWKQGSWLLQWSELLGATIVCSILIFAPFVSTSLIGVLLLAGAGYWILITLADDGSLKVTPIHILVFLYWCAASLALAFSPVKGAAVGDWVILTLYLLFFALAARILRSRTLTNWVITVLLLVSLVVSLYGIRQQIFGVQQLATWNDPNSILAQDTRVYSYLGNPNLLGGYLLSAIAFSIGAIFVWQGWLPKVLALTMTAINSACLYFTDSRGAWLSMLVLVAVFLLLMSFWWNDYLPRFWRVWLLPMVFGSLISLLIVAIVFVEPLRLRLTSIFVGREDSSNNFRINVWEAVFKMIRDYPLTGIGPGNGAFNQVYPRYMNSRYPALSAYSIFLEHLVEMGYIGLICFLWLIVVIFDRGVRQLAWLRNLRSPQGFWLMAAMATVAGMLMQGLFDTVWYRPQVNTLWWLMLAIIASHNLEQPPENDTEEISSVTLN